jgi:polysaccharide biosynthesis/export protein
VTFFDSFGMGMETRYRFLVLFLPLLNLGCLRSDLRQNQFATTQITQNELYRVGCGDVLQLTFSERPDWDCLCSVDVDGTLPLSESLGRVRVQGLTFEEIKQTIAKSVSIKSSGINITLADARAHYVLVMGPVNNRSRVLPYSGPEPVVNFLVRVGAIQTGTSNNNRIYVVRPNVAVNEKTDIYHVDVDAIVLDSDHETNLNIAPGDKIYVGETRRSSFSRLLPGWMRPIYRKIVGVLPLDQMSFWDSIIPDYRRRSSAN